jgi:hypothetical protein
MMPTRECRSRRWSEEEDLLLRTLADGGKSLTLMAVKLNRPMTAIKHRALELSVNIAGTEIGERRKRKYSA